MHRSTRERKLATLVVSHEINLMRTVCHGIILMNQGTIRHQGPFPGSLDSRST